MVALGVIALVVAMVCAAMGRLGSRASRLAAVTCADLVRHEGRAIVSGVVEPLPDGLVYAPVSGRSCVWFTSTVVEHWVEHDRDRVRDFDGDGLLHRTEMRPARRGRSRAETRTSARAFLLRDETGSVVVEPAGLRADRLPASVSDSVDGSGPAVPPGVLTVDFAAGAGRSRRSSRYERSETVLVPGERVFICGQVLLRRDGTAVLGGRDLTVSRRPPTACSARNRLRQRGGWLAGMACGLIGVAALLAGSARH
ncbi:GIDE domain-containing protein [Yinghuangia soli]|uniref:RING-type E3 ubiquitin transferase n=1 Tax=Yinghuangia soli TaxID=2908204 RepID=A0AA41Q0V4_9ACTN|nr:GIDE domain-containing protein [Yinghuangia soli]MCF2529489.1 hypothetical protein [Yinghuangia soli]